MRKTLKHRIAALLTLVSLALGGSAVLASPAQAYDNGNGAWRFVRFNANTCNTTGGYGYFVYSDSDYCTVEGVKYAKQSGGVALYATFTPNACCGGGDVAFRVEWHPGGEHMKVCDMANDGDGIAARLEYKSYNWYWKPSVGAPGTNAVVECTDANYDFIEGTEIQIYLYDDGALTDFMVGFYGLYA